jgi:hypothetical protein
MPEGQTRNPWPQALHYCAKSVFLDFGLASFARPPGLTGMSADVFYIKKTPLPVVWVSNRR